MCSTRLAGNTARKMTQKKANIGGDIAV